jgi:hypothetical protein
MIRLPIALHLHSYTPISTITRKPEITRRIIEVLLITLCSDPDFSQADP